MASSQSLTPSLAILPGRARDLLLSWIAASAAVAIALCVSLSVADPNLLLAVALALGAIGVIGLMAMPRLELSVAALALYLGLLDGPVKLLSASQAASSVRDILIAAVCLGALARVLARRERLRLPPLSGWVLAFVALVLVESFNPNTHGIVKVIGGFRQQLEWVPFFFFGYAVMRSRSRFRHLFVVLGVIALANGIVSVYQTRLTPGQLASWGQGYAARVEGSDTLTARRYKAENGETFVRPPALGSDSGFGGSVGVLAIPGTLALIAIGRRRRRWLAVPLFLGAVLAVATGLGRLQVVGAVIAVAVFVLLVCAAGHRARRLLAPLSVALVLVLPFVVALAAFEGKAVFSRYGSISPSNVVRTSTTYKERSLSLIPHYIASAPFGFGLATAGPASTFGGAIHEELEGHGVTAETEYNFLVDELGLPGLALIVALILCVAALVLMRMPRLLDPEIQIALAAVFAPLFALAIMGLRGAFSDTAVGGPYLWFAVGVAAYWLTLPSSRRALEAARKAGPERVGEPV